MSDDFTPKPLGAWQIDQAFALVQLCLGGVGLDDWRRYAKGLIECHEDRAGILTVQSGGYIYGLFSYRVESERAPDRRLRVETFVVLDLPQWAGPAAVMVAAVDRLAAAFGCPTVHLTLQARQPARPRFWHWLAAQFHAQGYLVDGRPPGPVAANDNQRLDGRPLGRERCGGAGPGTAPPCGSAGVVPCTPGLCCEEEFS